MLQLSADTEGEGHGKALILKNTTINDRPKKEKKVRSLISETLDTHSQLNE